MFQFQIGSIKSIDARCQKHADATFQFQIGSIKSEIEFPDVSDLAGVSIPNWFD